MSADGLIHAAISVRDLASFVHRRGDLGSDRRSVLSAAEGIKGHRWLQSDRPKGYRPEVSLTRKVERGGISLKISGRADGVDEGSSPVAVEEIKTVASPLVLTDPSGDPVHWAQARIYAAMLARERDLPHVEVRLAYLHFESRQVRTLKMVESSEDLERFWKQTVDAYLKWLEIVVEHRLARDGSIRALPFPFPRPRPGQPELATACENAMLRGNKLFVQAATGSGKTMAFLYGAVRALGTGSPAQIFFLTSRTTGRLAASKAFSHMMRGGLVIKALIITARDKICPHPGSRCISPDCPLAAGHHDRIRGAVSALFEAVTMDAPTIAEVAGRHRVCPFELTMEMLPWADAVVCDVNYVFDPAVSPKVARTEVLGPRGYLVDEAHNLVDRAREMFSAAVASKEVRVAAVEARKHSPHLARTIDALGEAMGSLAASTLEEGASHGLADHPGAPLLEAMREFIETVGPLLGELPDLRHCAAVTGLFFSSLAFTRFAQQKGNGHAVLVTATRSGPEVELYCVDPSVQLQAVLNESRSAVFFSATLTPMSYFARVLAGSSRHETLLQPSPFPRENLLVLASSDLSTRFRDRGASLEGVVEMLGVLASGRVGNRMVYLPSYKYLEVVAREFEATFPHVEVLKQRPGMTDQEREAFLETFSSTPGATLVGFAVLGGAFAEGIDLVGDRLTGAAIVSVGLPGVGPHRELIRARFEEDGEDGFAFAYVYPGICKVLQAVGRVVRGPEERGVIMLLDSRFNGPPYRDLLPGEWEPLKQVSDPRSAAALVAGFWSEKNSPTHDG